MGKNIKLSANDTKKTLSAIKKAKPPKTVLIKNITDYWPVLDDAKVENFVKILEQLLAGDSCDRQHVTVGLESTLRNLNSRAANISTLAIADEISPKWFGKHLISMALAKNHQIKVIILPKMKDHTKQLLKVPTLVWSIKTSAAGTNSLDEFYREINIHGELLRHYCTIKPNSDVSTRRKKIKDTGRATVPEIVYLKKTSSSPAFDPGAKESNTLMEFEDNSDFISLSQFDDPDLVNKSSPMPAYRTLKVNKIVGNLLRKGKK